MATLWPGTVAEWNWPPRARQPQRFADPGHPAMRDRVNAMVKMREAFRPFAPAALKQATFAFDVAPGTALPYMIAIVDVPGAPGLPSRHNARERSARLQTVSVEDDPDFHALLRAVGKTTRRESY